MTLVQRGPHLLDREDPEISTAIEEVFRAEGIDVVLGARVVHAGAREGGGVTLTLEGGRELPGSHLLAAVGRRPNTDDLGCAEGGVELDAKGYVRVDDRYLTSADGVYAVGDVTGGPQFTHTSWDDHRILLDVLEGRPARSRSGRVIPYTVFTDPQVGGVGLTEREARARGVAYQVASMPFGHVARAIETGETAGVMKVLVTAGPRPDPRRDHRRRRGRRAGARLRRAHAGRRFHPGGRRHGGRAPDLLGGVAELAMRLPGRG